MKKLSPSTLLSLLMRTGFFMSFSIFLGIYTYDQSDFIFTTIYLTATALTLYFPPIYEFLIPEPPTPILQKLKRIDKKALPTIISICIFFLTILILKHL